MCSLRLHVAGQILIRRSNNVGGAHHVARGDGEGLSLLKRDGNAIHQAPGADLRPLQVLKNANRSFELEGDLAQPANHHSVVFMRAVRKVQPCNVHPALH